MPRGTGLNKKEELSDELADFMGKATASRAEVTKKIWAHIKKYDLQKEGDRRTILPDDELSPILGSKPLNMLKIAVKVSEHIIK